MSTASPTTPNPSDPTPGTKPPRPPGAHRNPATDDAAPGSARPPQLAMKRTGWDVVLGIVLILMGIQLIVDGVLLMVVGRLRLTT